jgi:hypothetical protein
LKTTIEYERFFAYSEQNNKYFETPFNKGINIVHGKNTSGKSTFIQALLYTFGINDEKSKLAELLQESVVFRLDFILKKEIDEQISIIRDADIIVIKRESKPPMKFIGISGDSSAEHIKLKKTLGELFGFSLFLESSGEYKPAAIEAMFLPYYIAQDVGWVYKHKSFRGLDFVKNFKFDFFDYYLGVYNDFDRDEKKRLEKEKLDIENEIKFLSNIERKNDELQLAKLKDEIFIIKSTDYIEPYKVNKTQLIEFEKQYLDNCNKLTLLEQKKLVLQRVQRALKKQVPIEGECPTCNQVMPSNSAEVYNYHQDLNDTKKQLSELSEYIQKLKETKGTINTLVKKINSKRELVEKDYNELIKYNVENLTYDSWIKNKVNVELSEKILKNIGESTLQLTSVINQLSEFKTDEQVKAERIKISYQFKTIFEKHIIELGVKPFDIDRFYLLYDIPAFPRQGVELLKTLLSYCFSFNQIIKNTSYVHRFPFMLDAIFEGDLEDDSRGDILTFISKNKPSDTQVIFSIADSKTNQKSAVDYNNEYFNGEASLICIGGNTDKRAFLKPYEDQCNPYLKETLSYLE